MSNVAVLRETLELVLAKDDAFPATFYDRLFEAHPEVKPLFHRSSEGGLIIGGAPVASTRASSASHSSIRK